MVWSWNVIIGGLRTRTARQRWHRTKQTPVWEQLAPTGGKEDTDRDGDRVFGFSQRQRISRRKYDQLLKRHHVSAQLDRQWGRKVLSPGGKKFDKFLPFGNEFYHRLLILICGYEGNKWRNCQVWLLSHWYNYWFTSCCGFNVNLKILCAFSYVSEDKLVLLTGSRWSWHCVLQMLWLGVNTWMFLNTFLLFSSGEQYYYLYKMLGVSPDAQVHVVTQAHKLWLLTF